MFELNEQQQAILEQAQVILTKVMEEKPFYQGAQEFTEPSIAKLYFQTIIGNEERENFVVLFLDRIHRLIKSEVMFQGSVSETSVSIREIIRQALKLNASAIIIGHNHPTGNVEPSEADRHITKRLKEVCELMEIKLLDHFIVSGSASFCFTDNHLM